MYKLLSALLSITFFCVMLSGCGSQAMSVPGQLITDYNSNATTSNTLSSATTVGTTVTSTTQNNTATTTTAKTTKTETTATKTTSSVTTRPNNDTGKFELYILDKDPNHSEYLSGIATLENDGGIIALGRKYTEPDMPPTTIIDKLDKNFKIVKSVAINNATAVDIWSDSNNYIVKLYGKTSGHHFY